MVARRGDIMEWIDAMNPYNANVHEAPGIVEFTAVGLGVKHRIRWLDRTNVTPYVYIMETVKLYCPGDKLF